MTLHKQDVQIQLARYLTWRSKYSTVLGSTWSLNQVRPYRSALHVSTNEGVDDYYRHPVSPRLAATGHASKVASSGCFVYVL